MSVQIDLSKRYVAQVQYVAGFNRDPDVRLKQHVIEKTFRSLFGGAQSVQTNMPDEFSGRAPRIIFNAKNKNLAISQVAVTLSLKFEQSDGDVSRQLDVVEKNIRDVERVLPRFQETNKLRESGLVLVVNYPSDLPVPKLCEHLYAQFISFPAMGDVVSNQVTLGFRVQGLHYLSLSCSAYEKHQGESLAAVNAAGDVVFDPADLPVIEHGVEVKIDINDRPRIESGDEIQTRDTIQIFEKAKQIILNELDRIMGFV